MSIEISRARRSVVLLLGGSLTVSAIALSPLVIGVINPSMAVAAPLDCAPVGVERINDQLYYVENCYGYDVYRPL